MCRYNPIKTTKTSFMGTMNMLGLAKRTKVCLTIILGRSLQPRNVKSSASCELLV